MENLSKMRLSLLPKQLNYESIEIPTELKRFVEEDLPHLIGEINQDEPVDGCIEWVWAAWRSCINILHRTTFNCCWIIPPPTTPATPVLIPGQAVGQPLQQPAEVLGAGYHHVCPPNPTFLSSSWASACLPSSSLLLTPSTRSAAAYESAETPAYFTYHIWLSSTLTRYISAALSGLR